MKIIKKNKRAAFDFFLLKTYTAGIVLTGAEVKEIRAGHISLAEAYVKVKDDGLYLWNATITSPMYAKVDSSRERKLLLHKLEITEIRKELQQRGNTLIPTIIGLDRGLIKIEIAVARGKKKFDKRETIKKRESDKRLRILSMEKNRQK